MSAIIKGTMLTGLALAMAVPTATPSFSQSRDAFVGGVVGGVVGGLIGSSVRRHREPDVVYVQPRRRVIVEREPVIVERRVVRSGYSQAHYDYCYGRYNSYQASSNTFVTFSGRVRQCRSPY